VKRLLYFAAFVLVGAFCYYAYLHPEQFGFGGSHALTSAPSANATSAAVAAPLNWQPVNRATDGFNLEMPGDTRQLQVPAYNQADVSEPVNLIVSSPDGETSYAVAWADNPPSMRIVRRAPDSTLDTARDGLLARTQTTLVSEARCRPQGFPGRDLLARNAGGGVMDARLIFAGQRLYMLTAAYPSMGARREQDVKRFFNSFTVAMPDGGPASVPAAGQSANRR
jgi:hypothetical protein